MFLTVAMATLGRKDASEEPVPIAGLKDVLLPVFERFVTLCEEFLGKPISPQVLFDLEQQLQVQLREIGRTGLEWLLNHLEPSRKADMPSHVEFESDSYTRTYKKTPQEVATLFGKIRLRRFSYRPTHKTSDPTIFPLMQQLGIVAAATPALAERAAFYQAEAGATQRRTLQRLKKDHGVNWGVKKLREVTERVSVAMTEERHEVQVEKLLELLEKAYASKGKHKPVLSVGRDGITVKVPVRGGFISEVACVGTVEVLDRRGKRLGTVYLAYMPESNQPTMTLQLTRLVEEVLRRWEQPLPRLCYVTDSGDNETKYYETVLKGMLHPRTKEKLNWVRVADYYHASLRLWTMAETLFGSGPAAKRWVRRMQKLLLKPNGIRNVLNSASALRSLHELKGKPRVVFGTAYNYMRERMEFMRYAAYLKVNIPRGSGVTEAACKTIYTQRLKLSGMIWKTAGAQTILNLRVMLLSDVWEAGYRRVLSKVKNVKVPPYALFKRKGLKKAA
jgi:hypothetical protein